MIYIRRIHVAGLLALCLPGAAVWADAPVLSCLFTPECGDDDCLSDRFTLEIGPIDHEAGIWFTYDGNSAPVIEVTPEDATTRSLITRGHADREIVTLFDTGEAIHARHFYTPGVGPRSLTSFGQCEEF